jgi:predicted GNAT superfamily acetyltransferase
MEDPADRAGAGREAAADGVTLRPLQGQADFAACVDLQLATWGRDFQEAVPPSILKISQRVGGVAAGAFSPDGRLLGFVYGQSGVRPRADREAPELVHWSHMLAVSPEARDRGLGTRLKLYQRELLLQLEVDVVEWTFDPLEARNAHLNLNRLGAEVAEYVVDMYAGEMGSELARGIGTDRFIVAWRIGDARVRAMLDAGSAAERTAGPATFSTAPLITPGRHDDGELPQAARVRVEIPADVQALKAEQPERAWQWRLLTRRALRGYLARGYRVGAFWRDPAEGRCFYGVEAGD